MSISDSALAGSIGKGLTFLYHHQLLHGEFLNYYSDSEDMLAPCSPQSLSFNTPVVCYAMSFLSQDYERADEIIAKAIHFLRAHSQYGVWSFVSKINKVYTCLPFDVDSTSLAAHVFRERGEQYPGDTHTTKIILANRNRKDLFYTWILPRFSSKYSKPFLRTALHVLFDPIRHIVFWNWSDCNYSNIDWGVNANVLFFLGDRPETQSVISSMIDIIIENRESTCDKWYRNPFVIYYFFSKNYYKGITKLEPIRQPIINRITARAHPDGRIGNSLFDTCLSVCVLLNLNFHSTIVDKAIQYIVSAQHEYGNWERWALFSSGNIKKGYAGAEEVTTAFCLEALARYRKIKIKQHQREVADTLS
ncbi:MAG: hypothetical protein J7623_06840 [Chitinophaga sp.]|uniref:hypothetical protein n=1 Tax=Chitinophaga sp. TaxID=1869181 RepID=UPI001B27DF61|nr:hypothetical protein [Chitinophaga sp.]MBO9728339.1 hypothetical protein [Chitinophaga sp.]